MKHSGLWTSCTVGLTCTAGLTCLRANSNSCMRFMSRHQDCSALMRRKDGAALQRAALSSGIQRAALNESQRKAAGGCRRSLSVGFFFFPLAATVKPFRVKSKYMLSSMTYCVPTLKFTCGGCVKLLSKSLIWIYEDSETMPVVLQPQKYCHHTTTQL